MNTTLTFLQELSKNNNREWFNDNRKSYEAAKAEFEEFLNDVIPALRNFDDQIGTLKAKDCMFRIFRDVRFSKNKDPYKTNMGGFISKGGRKGIHAGYYIHIEPEKSFLGGGIYMPQSDVLKKIRQEILYQVDEFKSIINDKNFLKTYTQMEGNKLVRPPKGFPADFPDIELLKYKSYVAVHELSNDDILKDNFKKHIAKTFKVLHPFNAFLNRSLD